MNVEMMGTIDIYTNCSYEFNAYSSRKMAYGHSDSKNVGLDKDRRTMNVEMMGTTDIYTNCSYEFNACGAGAPE